MLPTRALTLSRRTGSLMRLSRTSELLGTESPHPDAAMPSASSSATSSTNACVRRTSELHRVTHDRAGHAVSATASTTELGPDNGDHLDTRLTQQRVRV